MPDEMLAIIRRRSTAASRRAGHHTPRLWPVPLAAAVALLVACGAAWPVYLRLRAAAIPRAVTGGSRPSVDVLDVIKTTVTVMAFVGAVLAGLYAYRKQRLAEGDARRADEAQLTARYTAAAEQLGHEQAAVRLAGVYALASLADEWDKGRQTCIEVLCSYLRLPYCADTNSPKHREGEREVRRMIVRIIRDHLRPESQTSWRGSHFSFERAVFDVADLSRADFGGCRVSFHRAQFLSGTIDFQEANFDGARVWFTKAKFLGANVLFTEATFSLAAAPHSRWARLQRQPSYYPDDKVVFDEAEFTTGNVSFTGAKDVRNIVTFKQVSKISAVGVGDRGPFQHHFTAIERRSLNPTQ